MLQTLKTKLSSRKFWVAIISIIAGILGVLGADDDLIKMVSSVGLILIPTIIYIFIEGKIDASALSSVDIEALIKALQVYTNSSGNSASAIYSVTYDGTGAESGTVPTDGNKYSTGDMATVLDNTGNLAKSGYTFSGWNTAADKSGTAYAVGATLLITENIVLYAIWTAATATDKTETEATAAANTGNTAKSTTDSSSSNTLVSKLKAVIGVLLAAVIGFSSYTVGTVTSTNGGTATQTTAIVSTVTPTATTTASTESAVIAYKVTYNSNGATSGAVPTDSGSYAEGKSVTVLGNTGGLAKDDYIFAGWNTAADGSGVTCTAGATLIIGKANVTLYAIWTPSTVNP
jgi:uncharacterized repeat protein (TIGR02543 family)